MTAAEAIFNTYANAAMQDCAAVLHWRKRVREAKDNCEPVLLINMASSFLRAHQLRVQYYAELLETVA